MSEASGGSAHVGFSFSIVPWFVIFVVIKYFGVSLAAWSWWWMFLAIVPVVWLGVSKLGLL